METVARITVQNPNLTEAQEGALQPVKKLAQQRPLVLKLLAQKVVQKDVKINSNEGCNCTPQLKSIHEYN